MPQLANVVINDGAATPVARTFSPGLKGTDGMQRWFEKTSVNAIGFWTLGQKFREPLTPKGGVRSSDQSRMYQTTIKVQLPVLETTSAATGTGIPPAPTVAYTPWVEVTFSLPERSTVQDRKHLRLLLINYLSHANAVATIEQLEPIFG